MWRALLANCNYSVFRQLPPFFTRLTQLLTYVSFINLPCPLSSVIYPRLFLSPSFLDINICLFHAISFNPSLPTIHLFSLPLSFFRFSSFSENFNFFFAFCALSIFPSPRLFRDIFFPNSHARLFLSLKLNRHTLLYFVSPILSFSSLILSFNTFIPYNFIKPFYFSLIVCLTFSIPFGYILFLLFLLC